MKKTYLNLITSLALVSCFSASMAGVLPPSQVTTEITAGSLNKLANPNTQIYISECVGPTDGSGEAACKQGSMPASKLTNEYINKMVVPTEQLKFGPSIEGKEVHDIMTVTSGSGTLFSCTANMNNFHFGIQYTFKLNALDLKNPSCTLS